MEQELKSGIAAIIGRPNVGKSTMMNRLIGQKIAITSDKPQTTRNRIRTVYTDERGQIVFIDTPGIHKSRSRLGDFMVKSAEKALEDVDLVLYIIEPSAYVGEFEQSILELLRKVSCPVFLIINKSDTVKKEELLPVIAKYSGEFGFAEIIPISALKGRNMEDLLNCIFKYLPKGPLFYDEDTVTDQSMRRIAEELVREQALNRLSEEIPHGIAVVVEQMTQRHDGMYDVEASIICEKASHKGIIIGKNGSMLKSIGQAARREIEDMTQTRVNLKLWVKVRKDWRNNDLMLKSYGYREDER